MQSYQASHSSCSCNTGEDKCLVQEEPIKRYTKVKRPAATAILLYFSQYFFSSLFHKPFLHLKGKDISSRYVSYCTVPHLHDLKEKNKCIGSCSDLHRKQSWSVSKLYRTFSNLAILFWNTQQMQYPRLYNVLHNRTFLLPQQGLGVGI